jgi:uncharacterized damage-inducible protein DinB
MEVLDRLLEHDQWATATLLEASRDLTDAQLDQEFDIGRRTLRATYKHMIPNVEFWTGLMIGQPVAKWREDLSVAEFIDFHQRVYPPFATLAYRLRDEQRLDDTFADHYGVPQTYGGVILMVILHNTEHRTEVSHFLQRLGVADVSEVDYGLWDLKRRGLF